MSATSHKIASETKNCSFSLQSIEKFLALMTTQQTEYSNFSYKANGPFSLVLRAKKNGIADVALKVLECTDRTDCKIKAMESEYAMCKQLPSSDYFMTVQSQFFLTEIYGSAEQDQNGKKSTARKVYFIQEMEMCEGNLDETIQWFSQNGKDPPSESFKEVLAIQMLDTVNLLHQRQVAHGNITTQHFLVSSSSDYPVILKLCNLHCFSHQNPVNSVEVNKSLHSMFPMTEIQRDWMEQDLVFLGKVFLQLDSIGTNCDQSPIFNYKPDQPDSTTILEMPQLNRSTLLYKIACSFLSKSKENSKSARSMLLFLLQKQAKTIKIPLFSVVLKSQLDSLRLSIPFKTAMLDCLLDQVSKQRKLHNVDSQFNTKGSRKTELTVDQLKSALNIMLEWKEFSEVYDVLGVGVSGVVFGVENLKENRKSALKLSLCTNQADTIRKIRLRRICQAPCIVKFYGSNFFKDANGNQFVVYELERCKYSLTHQLELQRMNGQLSEEQKHSLTLQILDSVSFLHENRILHRNINLGSFLIADNGAGKEVLKLGNFSHLAQLKENYENCQLDLKRQVFNLQYKSSVNCIVQRHDRESPLYFAPERWENPTISTYFTDCYSVGLCIFLLDNYLVCSEEQLARKLISLPRGSAGICLDINTQIITTTGVDKIAKQLLGFLPQQRTSLRQLIKECTESQDENDFQWKNMLIIEGLNELDEQKQALMKCVSLSLNLNQKWIGDNNAESLLNPIRNLLNLSSLTLDLNYNQIGDLEAQSLLSPIANLLNLSNLTLNLYSNQIGDVGAQSLLYPLANLLNLSTLALNLNQNQIGDVGAQSLLSPLVNLLNLSGLELNLFSNQIGEKGALFLLSPLANLLNLSSITLDLNCNQIGDMGAQSLLSPLTNLLNLSSLALNLNQNQIENYGAQFLLSPLANLLNLSSLALNLNQNQIGEIGAKSLLSPLSNLFNLSELTLNLMYNQIGDIGEYSLFYPLFNLLSLTSLDLQFYCNLQTKRTKHIFEYYIKNLEFFRFDD